MPQQLKISEAFKQETQDISCAVQFIVEEEGKNKILSELNAFSLFEKVTPEKLIGEQQNDQILELVYPQVTAHEKPKTSAVAKIKYKAKRKYLLWFNRLTIKRVFFTESTLTMM